MARRHGYIELHRVRAPWKALQINFRARSVWFDDAIDQESRDGQCCQSRKENHRDDCRKKLGIPLGWIAELEEN